MLACYSHSFLTVSYYWYGFCELSGWGTAGPWYPPQPCRDPSQNLITMCITLVIKKLLTHNGIRAGTMSWNNPVWKSADSALTTSKFGIFQQVATKHGDTRCSLYSQNFLSLPYCEHQGISISPYDRDKTRQEQNTWTKKKMALKTFILILSYIR